MADVRKRILVVDDDHDCRLTLSSLMGRSGYTVDAVADGEMAISLVRNNRPDAVLLDAQLPRKDGFEVCRMIKGDPEISAIPVIMLTAFSAETARARCLEAGADDFVEKPFRNERLIQVLDRLLGRGKPAASDGG